MVYLPKRELNRKSYRLSLDWIYGNDVIQELKIRHPDWNFIVADGTRNEENFFKDIDVLLRPSRCDGWAIMVKEAQYCKVPVIWSFETGEYVEPNVDEIEYRIKKMDR